MSEKYNQKPHRVSFSSLKSLPELIAKNKVAAQNFKAACLATQLRLEFPGVGDELIQVVQKRGTQARRGQEAARPTTEGLRMAGTQWVRPNLCPRWAWQSPNGYTRYNLTPAHGGLLRQAHMPTTCKWRPCELRRRPVLVRFAARAP